MVSLHLLGLFFFCIVFFGIVESLIEEIVIKPVKALDRFLMFGIIHGS